MLPKAVILRADFIVRRASPVQINAVFSYKGSMRFRGGATVRSLRGPFMSTKAKRIMFVCGNRVNRDKLGSRKPVKFSLIVYCGPVMRSKAGFCQFPSKRPALNIKMLLWS